MGAGHSKAIQPVSKFVFTNFEEEHHSTTGERLLTDLHVSEFQTSKFSEISTFWMICGFGFEPLALATSLTLSTIMPSYTHFFPPEIN